MTTVVADCPRCGANATTFDVHTSIQSGSRYGWQRLFEHHCICRHCHRSSLLIGEQRDPRRDVSAEDLPRVNSLNDIIDITGYISLKNENSETAPDNCPADIAAAFNEGAACFSINCFNAAAAMFRLCLDLSTRPLLPEGDVEGLTRKVRRDLGLRLPWLFQNHRLPNDLEPLSHCIREDGNDGAHAGLIGKDDAADALDFTREFLRRLYTEPGRIAAAAARRDARRNPV